MEAEIGHNPSFVWRSLVAATEVIMEGFRWRVGNGMQIRAESRNWLSHKPIFRRQEWLNLRVGDLIDDRAWEWKRTMIVEIFAPRNYEEILAIPLSRERTQDALIWKENRKHEFSIKSAYHVALWLNKQEVTEHSQAGADGELVRISCQLVTICTSEEWTWIETVNSVANNLKRVHTCCGSVHLLVMLVSVQWESAEMQE